MTERLNADVAVRICERLIDACAEPEWEDQCGVAACLKDADRLGSLSRAFDSDGLALVAVSPSPDFLKAKPLHVKDLRELLRFLVREKAAGLLELRTGGIAAFLSLSSTPEGVGLNWGIEDTSACSGEWIRSFLRVTDLPEQEARDLADALSGGHGIWRDDVAGWQLRHTTGQFEAILKGRDAYRLLDQTQDAVLDLFKGARVLYLPYVRPTGVEPLREIVPGANWYMFFNFGHSRTWKGRPEGVVERTSSLAREMELGEWLRFRWLGFRWGKANTWHGNELLLEYVPSHWNIRVTAEDRRASKEARASLDDAGRAG